MNEVKLVGRIGKDPVTITTKSQRSFCRFPLATQDSWKNKETGEWVTGKTNWFQIIGWNEMATRLSKFEKGQLVHLEGRLTSGLYTDKKGIRRQNVEVVVRYVEKKRSSKKNEFVSNQEVIDFFDSIIEDL